MTRIKRILSMLLVWCMVFGLLPNIAFAADGTFAFDDVQESDWFYDDVNYVYTHDLIKGTSATTFAPQATTTRAMIVTILHRLEGTPSASNSGFSDVTAGQYFTEAVDWAAEQNIVNGYGNGMFGPNDNITREQMATILYRYATYKNYDVTKKADCSTFSDADKISDYATDALAWCNAESLINGMGNNMLAPKGNAIRAQVAAILTRFCKNIVPSEPENFVESKTYTVTFNLNYGKNETYKSEKVAKDEKVDKPSDPARKGYTFKGWYTKKSGGRQFDFKSGITSDLTLYAHWSSNSSSSGVGGSSGGGGDYIPPSTTHYTVTFDANGGTTSTSYAKVASGSPIGTLPTATREGYTFLGWYTASSGGTEITASTMVNADMTIYAHWSSRDDEIYTDIEDYFDDVGLTVLDTVTASTSTSVQTEAEVKEFLEARGFGQRQIEEYTIGYPITYSELMNGTVVDETEVEGDSDIEHPLYYTFYLANSDTEDPILWAIYMLNGSVFAYPTSFSTQTDSYKEVIVTENTDGSIISYLDGKYYNLSSNGESVVTKAVETIDVAALNAIDFAALCSLTGASRIELFDASSVASDTYVQANTVATGARARQNVPERYGEKFIAIALGDSYISGESISPYIGQYDDNGRAVSREDRVRDDDWMSHRSTASWPSRLSIPDIAGTLKDYYVPYQETSDADIQWYFYAISGATTEHYDTNEFIKDYTLPKDIPDPFLGRITVEVQHHRNLPKENEVFNYIDNLEEIDYVFMSLGGNDANFADIVADVFVHSQSINPKTWFGGDSKLVRDLDAVWRRRGEIINHIGDVIKDIHANAPNATIIQAGYPKLYVDGGSGWSASKNEAKLVNEKVSGFNALIRERIELLDNTMDVRFVNIEKKFAGHSAYSHNNKAGVDGAWLNPVIIPSRDDDLKQGILGISSAASMHPNEYGARAYAEAVNAVIEQADGDRKGARSISGVITISDEDTDMTNNLPLEGARISLVNLATGARFSGMSGSDGSYKIENLATGNYEITITKTGYITISESISIANKVENYYNAVLVIDSTSNEQDIPDDAVYFNSHAYKFYDQLVSWQDAKKYCENLGGHLVTITSPEEQDFLSKYLSSSAPDIDLWIGIRSDWTQWITGEEVSYKNWGTNEPDGHAGQCYGAICNGERSGTNSEGYYHMNQGEWDDLHEDDRMYYICEWDLSKDPHPSPTVSGTVIEGIVYASDDDSVDSNNTKIEGASVTLIDNGTGEKSMTTTNKNGYYKIKDIPHGEYTIQVEKAGFETYEDNAVNFADSESSKTVNVFLNVSSGEKIIVGSGDCGINLKWTLTDDGILTIYGTGEMTSYNFNLETRRSNAPWIPYAEMIKTVVLKEGITNIGNFAFHNCVNLSKVDIPLGVTNIGDSAFRSCSSLVDVEIPAGVTSIGNSAFAYCKLQEILNIPTGVVSIGNNAFESCDLIQGVKIPLGVTSIGDGAFLHCSHLIELVIPVTVTSIGESALDGTWLSEYGGKVYYGGSGSDWARIAFGPHNTWTTRADIYFNRTDVSW